ncbi:MAG: peroxiredoxin [Alphaproteobacteria bacterium]|nr:peroxiredoxin [Alphaproteobacteria bacterium]
MIKVGDKIPEARVPKVAAQGSGFLNTREFFAGKKVILFGVPGAFTPVCSEKHLPGFMELAGKIHAKGVSDIVCLSVNDRHVMNAWAKDQNVGDTVILLADGNAEFTKALGMDIDIDNMGVRSKRFALIVDNGVVTKMALEDSTGAHDVSSAEAMLKLL